MTDDTTTENTTETEGAPSMSVTLRPEAAAKLAAIVHATDKAREVLTYTRLTVTSETVTAEATDSYMLVRRVVPCRTENYTDAVTVHVSAKQFADAVKGSKYAVSLVFKEGTVEVLNDDRTVILCRQDSALDHRSLWNGNEPVEDDAEYSGRLPCLSANLLVKLVKTAGLTAKNKSEFLIPVVTKAHGKDAPHLKPVRFRLSHQDAGYSWEALVMPVRK